MFIKFRQPLGLRLLDKKRGVPADGEYLIRFCAKAVRRKSRYKDSDLRYNSDEPMPLHLDRFAGFGSDRPPDHRRIRNPGQ